MGKKRIAQETTEDVLKEREVVAGKQEERAQRSSAARKIQRGRFYIHASYNNTIVTVTDGRGDVIAQESAGALGFRGPKKATPFAATRVIQTVVEKIQRTGMGEVDVFIKGIGGGREAALRAIPTYGFDILSVHDVTPMPHNGPRPPRPRRV